MILCTYVYSMFFFYGSLQFFYNEQNIKDNIIIFFVCTFT